MIGGILIKILNRSVCFECRELGDGVLELKVYNFTSLPLVDLGFRSLRVKHYGSKERVDGFVYEELLKS